MVFLTKKNIMKIQAMGTWHCRTYVFVNKLGSPLGERVTLVWGMKNFHFMVLLEDILYLGGPGKTEA